MQRNRPQSPFFVSRLRWIASLLAIGLALLGQGRTAVAEQALTLGILAYRPAEQDLNRWQPLAAYLSAAIPNYSIHLRALGFTEINKALAQHQLDLLIASPDYLITIRHNSDLSGALATVVEEEEGKPLHTCGGVIFARNDHQDITHLADLKKHTIAVVDTKSLGGYQAPARELLLAGVDITKQCRLLLTDMPQDSVVAAVLTGKADAGFVSTGLLEAMYREGSLKDGQIKVLHRQQLPNFPYLISTRLYPERPFIALPHVPEDVSRQLAIALLSLDPDGAIAKEAGIRGFTVPADYSEVENLLRDLHLPPFETAPPITLADIWAHCQWLVLSLALSGLTIAALILQLKSATRRLQRAYLQADEERERLRLLINNLPDNAVFQYTRDRDGSPKFFYLSNGIERIIGIQEDAALLFDRVSPEAVPNLVRAERASIQDMSPLVVDLPLRTVDGRERWVHLCASPRNLSHGQVLWDGVLTDITDRKQMETALLESKSRLAKAQALTHLGSWQWDMNTNMITWSDETFRIFGYQPQEIVPDFGFFLTTLKPDHKNDHQRVIEATLSSGQPYNIEYAFFRKDGSLAYAHAMGEVIRSPDGQTAGMIGTIQDITDQKLAEQAILDSEAKFRGIFNNARDGILIANMANRRFTAANPAICEMLGYSEEELLHMGIDDIHPPEDLPRVSEHLKRQIEGEGLTVAALPTRKKDGSIFYADIRGSLLSDQTGTHTIGIFRDVTDRKLHEDTLHAALLEKEILIKEVHHRVKNNLQVITSMLNLQARRRDNPSLAAAMLELGSRVRAMALIHEKLYRATRSSTAPPTWPASSSRPTCRNWPPTSSAATPWRAPLPSTFRRPTAHPSGYPWMRPSPAVSSSTSW